MYSIKKKKKERKKVKKVNEHNAYTICLICNNYWSYIITYIRMRVYVSHGFLK